ncbi:MAG: hypothetical protein HQK63_11020 [Desulfamplus sp.]|nr:hypothetical protein [Desulfamplus sp.]
MKTSRINLIISVILLIIGTLSLSYASDGVLLTATINNKSLIFDTNSLPANATITSATLNITGSQTDNAVEPFQIMLLANGLVAGSLSSDDWENNIDNTIELDASKLNIINNQIQLQISSSLEGSEYLAEILPATATLLLNYAGNHGVKRSSNRSSNPILKMTAGAAYSVVLKKDGTVVSWGLNDYGQLGDGTTTNSSKPVKVKGLTNVIDVDASYRHTLALKNDGTVWAWGNNVAGKLGNGSTTDSSTPVKVVGLANVVAIAAGYEHSVVLKGDGTLWAWGLNNYG